MRITGIELFRVPPRWLFVKVSTDEGIDGWGEASLEGHSEAVEGALDGLRDRLVGADATRIEDLWQLAHRLGFYRGGPVNMSAISGVDQALWDIAGKALGAPVWRLLGGQVRERIEVYAWIGGDDPAAVAEGARARKAQGFRALKMNATAQLRRLDSPAALDAVLERVAAVKACGLDVGLDFHGRVHKPMVRQLARALEPLKPLFIEEPLLSEHIEGLAQLAAQTSIPIALGERLYSRWDFKPYLERGVVDIVQPDLAHAGGISEVRRIAAMAEAYDVALAPHCPLGPIALAACLQVAASTPNFAIEEMSLGIHYNREGADLLTYLAEPSVFDVADGHVAVPAGPGLGIVLDEDRIRAAAREPHRWRNPAWRHADGGLAEW
ncbi:MAG: galactonate dehydratase [Caulobacteraceae bacterium]|nr:galactonate dehydratase [Caulobacter sp.]